jgi:hypothetical protein
MGKFKRTGVVATILAMSGLGLFASREAPWQSTVNKLETDSHLDDFSRLNAEKQLALTDGWKDSLGTTLETADGLASNIKSVADMGKDAEKEISNWAEAVGTKNNKEIRKYVKTMAHATVNLINVQTDFKSWLYVQYTLYNINQNRLKRKFAKAKPGDDINIDTEFKIMDKALTKGLNQLKEMMAKVALCQTDFKVLAAKAKNMLREVEEQTKQLQQKREGWHLAIAGSGMACAGAVVVGITGAAASVGTLSAPAALIVAAGCGGAMAASGMTVEVACNAAKAQLASQSKKVSGLAERSNMLGDRASRDYENMSKVKSHMDALHGIMINDADLFRHDVMPELKKLVDLLNRLRNTQKIDR